MLTNLEGQIDGLMDRGQEMGLILGTLTTIKKAFFARAHYLLGHTHDRALSCCVDNLTQYIG